MDRPLSKRGTGANPENRYERLHVSYDPTDEDPPLATELYRDSSKTILAENDSPDVGFRFSLNPYRGCEHGCIYCYARPSHEYLSFSAGLDFERRILVKHDAAQLLRKTFHSAKWQPQVVALSGNTDCYQPVERRLGITRACLEVFRDFLNPVAVITKSALISRDVDLLAEMAGAGTASVMISITSLDHELARRMEPRAAQPERRLDAIRTLASAGVPVGVMTAPIVPGLNDEEIPAILAAAAEAGARTAGWVMVRLPKPVDELFGEWLERNYPARRERVLHRIRECRDGRISDATFGRRMRGQGVYAEQIEALFKLSVKRYGLDRPHPPANLAAFRRPPQAGDQLSLLM
ncbi:MAG TPA: PA0069 family radical SAM protein [Terriglobales bacterium]|nr:PA0069 family radical SAM protein [Terriglobales bacterium]